MLPMFSEDHRGHLRLGPVNPSPLSPEVDLNVILTLICRNFFKRYVVLVGYISRGAGGNHSGC